MLFPFVILVVFSGLMLRWSGLGGMDINYYKSSLDALDFSEVYYYKEPISWFFLAILDRSFNNIKDALVYLDFFIFLIFSFLKKNRFIYFLALFTITPMYYLLSMNVLRQYLALYFLILAIAIFNKYPTHRFWGLICGFAAILCHNSALIIFVFLSIDFFAISDRLRLIFKYILLVAITLFLFYVAAVNSGLLSYEEIDGLANPLKKIYYLAFIIMLVFLDYKNNRFFAFWALCIVSWPLTDWQIERIFITLCSITVYQFSENVENMAWRWLVVIFFFGIGLFVHSGVKEVVFGL